mmetsp:Transcript_10567/g.32824  ORF Transcript_10567/g.32824 Transcript_10567/m.32824 type:complete len:271 (+) Transcript_10567:49-861(+)
MRHIHDGKVEVGVAPPTNFLLTADMVEWNPRPHMATQPPAQHLRASRSSGGRFSSSSDMRRRGFTRYFAAVVRTVGCVRDDAASSVGCGSGALPSPAASTAAVEDVRRGIAPAATAGTVADAPLAPRRRPPDALFGVNSDVVSRRNPSPPSAGTLALPLSETPTSDAPTSPLGATMSRRKWVSSGSDKRHRRAGPMAAPGAVAGYHAALHTDSPIVASSACRATAASTRGAASQRYSAASAAWWTLRSTSVDVGPTARPASSSAVTATPS